MSQSAFDIKFWLKNPQVKVKKKKKKMKKLEYETATMTGESEDGGKKTNKNLKYLLKKS